VFNEVPGSDKAVVFAHGMTVGQDDEQIFVEAEKKMNELGFSTLRFDFRGHGKSSGNSMTDFTVSGELTDLETVIDFVRLKGVRWLGLAGASFGGSIVALYAGKYPNNIQALFLANPVLNYEKDFLFPTTSWVKKYFTRLLERIDRDGFIAVGSRKFKVGRALFEEMKFFHPEEELVKYENRLMMVHGDQDTYVSCKNTVDCFTSLSNNNKKLAIITGANHGFHDIPFRTQVSKIIVNFFQSN
jgi:hypothetical protein